MQQDDEGWCAEEFTDYDDPPEMPHGVRFGEGQPINRRGRPRGSPNRSTIVRRAAGKRHRVTIEGRIHRKNTIELIVITVKRLAATGNLQAVKLLDTLIAYFEPQPSKPRAILFINNKMTEDEWEAYYGSEMSDEEFESQYPYLSLSRKKHRAHQDEIRRQCGESNAIV